MAAVAPISYRSAGFELEPRERRLLVQGGVQQLGARTFDLLVTLVERRGRLVTKDELLAQVWGDAVVEENTLHAHMSVLRKVLGADAIGTVARKGYRFQMDVQVVAAPWPAPPMPRQNLPHPLTRFIGREEVLAELARLSERTRLLTLTGSGGCGKTRLAVEFARRQALVHADGAWLVELAALTDPALVPQTVAGVLGATEEQGVAWIDTLAQHLAPRAALLLLDNAEHLVDACAQLAETLLRRCERLVVLVTSRQRLGIRDELTFRVPSLGLPDPNGAATPDEIAASESTRLLLDRIRLHQPRFEVTVRNASAVGTVCRQLDGIALAIELAAARVRTLTIEELAGRLDRRFELLTDGSRTALPRQRTLYALVDWSYGLLDAVEQAMLRAVSVFAGGWTLDAAARVFDAVAAGRSDAATLLDSLAEKSLISIETRDAAPRYAMLETVRQYAAGRVWEAHESALLRERHLDCFLELAERAHGRQSAPDAALWLDRLELERDNLRAALDCAISAPVGEAGVRLVGALGWFWVVRGDQAEGRRWISAALEKESAPAGAAARIVALREASRLAHRQSDFSAARQVAEEALALALQSGDRGAIARGWSCLGAVALSQIDLDRAVELYRRALDLHRQLGDEPAVAIMLCTLGQVEQCRLEFAAAEDLLTQSVELLRAQGDARLPYALYSLGGVAHSQLQLQRARGYYEEALAAWRQSGHRDGIARVAGNLAQIAWDTRDITRVRPLIHEALTIQVELGNERDATQTICIIAEIFGAPSDPPTAARLWGFQHRLTERLGLPPMTYRERPSLLRAVADTRHALGAAAFQAAWDDGRAMEFNEALALAVKTCG